MAASRSRLSPELAERLHARLAALPLRGARLTLGFSGGLDSTVLLHLLAGLREPLGFVLDVVHVAHGLQAIAAEWPAHCRRVAAALGLECVVVPVLVDREDPQGLEAAARAARHAVLNSHGADWVVLAHHRGDQAETVLHRLTRGAGVAGAAAMRSVDPRDPGPGILRPLLEEPREALLDWAQAHGLEWIEDPSNADPRYSRNFIRHQILAPLNARFPGAEGALARAAAHFAEAQELLTQLARLDLANVCEGSAASFTRLLGLPRARLANLLRARLIDRGFLAPDQVRLDAALDQLAQAPSPWRASFGDWALCREDDRIWIESTESTPPPTEPLCWQGEAILAWGDLQLRFEATSEGGLALAAGAAWLKPREGGEKLRPQAGRPRRDLKTLGREAGIPPWWRDRLPVLWNAQRPVAWGPWTDSDARAAGPGWRLTVELPGRVF
ncbi:tRNA lysidine(34) synthetase TilS [Niveibacterium sp. SC-1]|uniref:tRNA lysidine(34) synthetase TilS n=1 Tax=Niveibacterium sp. SC-1 TaxID=3135646 RepID=UPI00311E3AA3